MNSSKKLKPKKVKKQKLSEKPITSISKPWLISSLFLVVLLVGALLFDQLYVPALMTIDGKKYHMNDLSYYFYTVESNFNTYGQLFGSNYWDMTYDEKKGTTLRDAAKDEAVDTCLRSEILYNEAVKQGYKLTADEGKTVGTNVKSLLSGKLSDAAIKKNNFTEAYLTNILNKATLVSRFRKDQIDAQNIDEDAIKKGISYDDYRQYDIEYLFIPTQTTDSAGKAVELSDAKKKAAYDKITAIYDKAKSTDDWSTLIPTDETDLTYKEGAILTKNDNSEFSDDFKTIIKKMENGDVSDIHKDTKGYYVIRMKDNKSTSSYDSAVQSAITTAEDTAFDKVYAQIKTKHKYSLNNHALKAIKMGSFTVTE